MEKLYTVSKNKTRNWQWLRSWSPYWQIQTEIEESQENHLEKAMAPHSSTLAWKIPWTEEPGRLHAVHGVAKSRTRLRNFPFTFHFHSLEKEMATHSSVLAWRIPGTEEPGGLPSMGSHRVGHNWSDLAAAAAAAGKTTRPLRYDLNQIPYDYTVEVRNRFKGLDVIDRVPDELWMEVCDIVQETIPKKQDHPQEKEMQKSKMAVWGGLTNSCEEKRKAKEKRKDIPIWMQSSKE